MEKKTVKCQDCVFAGSRAVNYLIDCNNEERNPKKYKVHTGKKTCEYFKKMKN